MLILEGADNVGKSTLLKQLLALDPSLRLLHRARFKPEMGQTIGSSYFQALLPEDGDRLRHANSAADRLIASECIYGQLFREECRLTLAEHHALTQLLESYGAKIVWCDTSDAIIRSTWTAREQMYERDPALIAEAYRQRVHQVFTGFEVLRYDWTHPVSELNRGRLVNEHQTSFDREALSWWSAMPFGIGCLRRPKIMVIGETLSPNAVVPIPFVKGPGSNFLAWALANVYALWPYLRNKTYTTNAIKTDGRNDVSLLREEARFLQPELVITLGRVAEEHWKAVTTREQFKHINLPHPQHWRKSHPRHEYVRLLTDPLMQVFGPSRSAQTPFYYHPEIT